MSLRFWATLLVGALVGLALFSVPESKAKCNLVEATYTLQRKSVTLVSGPATEQAVALETAQWVEEGALFYSFDDGIVRLLTTHLSVYSSNADALY